MQLVRGSLCDQQDGLDKLVHGLCALPSVHRGRDVAGRVVCNDQRSETHRESGFELERLGGDFAPRCGKSGSNPDLPEPVGQQPQRHPAIATRSAVQPAEVELGLEPIQRHSVP